MKKFIYFISVLSFASFASQPSAKRVRFPWLLSCRFSEPAPGAQEVQRLYTRLEKVKSLSSIPAKGLQIWNEHDKKDPPKEYEAAAAPWAGGYYGATLTAETYSYGAWSCDSEDRTYTFKTADLAISARKKVPLIRKVKGSVNIEVRGEGGDEPLDCYAYYRRVR